MPLGPSLGVVTVCHVGFHLAGFDRLAESTGTCLRHSLFSVGSDGARRRPGFHPPPDLSELYQSPPEDSFGGGHPVSRVQSDSEVIDSEMEDQAEDGYCSSSGLIRTFRFISRLGIRFALGRLVSPS